MDGHGSPGQAPAVHERVLRDDPVMGWWLCAAGAGLVPWARLRRDGRAPGSAG